MSLPGKAPWGRALLPTLPRVCVAALLAGVLLAAGCGRNLRLKPLPLAKGGNATLRVQLTYDRNNLLQIKVQGPEPSAYGPQYTRYVAWVATLDKAQVTNVGQIRVEGGKGQINTLTPLRKFRLFLTVEEQGDVLKPGPQVVFEAPKEIEW